MLKNLLIRSGFSIGSDGIRLSITTIETSPEDLTYSSGSSNIFFLVLSFF